MRIGINCGHTVSGQPGCGAVGLINESVETREVGNRLMAILKGAGHTVVNCTNDYAATTNANLAEICRLANAQPLDLFVSIHFNSGGGKGTEVFTYNGVRHAEAVAVCDKLHALGFVNRGVKNQSLYVINHTNAKAMLIEVCFVDSASDVELYRRLGAQRVAETIAEAITGKTVTRKESEELTVTQYEELKKEIAGLKPMIYNYMDNNMPDWAKPTIQKLMDKGILVGDNEGKLGLTMDMLRVFVANDRAGIYG